MKRVDIAEIEITDEIRELFSDALATIKQARKLEGLMYGDRVYGNQNLSVEAKIDFSYNKAKVDSLYDLVRYDCIEEINSVVGGNIVDMTGTDKQVCLRFYNKFKSVI